MQSPTPSPCANARTNVCMFLHPFALMRLDTQLTYTHTSIVLYHVLSSVPHHATYFRAHHRNKSDPNTYTRIYMPTFIDVDNGGSFGYSFILLTTGWVCQLIASAVLMLVFTLELDEKDDNDDVELSVSV